MKLIMVIMITFKMKIMKNNQTIDFMETITVNDNNHKNKHHQNKQSAKKQLG